jgi:2-aminoadipate transaminase
VKEQPMTTDDAPQGMISGAIALSFGHPDPATLLTTPLHNAMHEFLDSARTVQALQYGREQGAQELIELIAARINREQELSLTASNLMIVAGSTHAVDMVARLYAKPGGTVLVEAPTYADALHIFRDHALKLVAVPMDEDGLLPDALEEQLVKLRLAGVAPALLYTIPNFHNPTGRTVSQARRLTICELARRYGFLIVEDDVYHDLAFGERVPRSFFELAGGQGVVNIGSFSKTLAPGLRLGWLVGPATVIERCVGCGTTQMGGGANPFVAHMVAQYLQGGAYDHHLHSLRILYKQRRDVSLAALARFMPKSVSWTQPAGGFFLWLTLPERVFAARITRLAREQGVLVTSGEGFFPSPDHGAHHLRLAYSCAVPNELERGIRLLAQLIQQEAERSDE